MQVAGSQPSEILSQFIPSVHSQPLWSPEIPVVLESAVCSVAILEGNASLARLLATGFKSEAITVLIHESLDSLMQHMQTEVPDLLIMDLDLEGVDGPGSIAMVRTIQPSMRLLILSGQAGVERAAEALNRGADDYLVKPFSLLEMTARVRALLRRSGGTSLPSKSPASQLVLQKDQSRVTFEGRSIDLTPRECELLEFMMAHPGTPLSRATLSQHVWNMPAEANTNIVDVYVKYLRDKLETALQQKMIRTIRGVGYVFQQ